MQRETGVPLRRTSPRRCAAVAGVWSFLATWACFAGAGSALAQAQSVTPVRDRESSARLLTAEEGRAILDVAWQEAPPTQRARDCSHLVHEIYAHAGFAYPYASSFEIYAGNHNFVRMKFARAGDLIAWPGHVGIVVDPVQHSFYSLVRTGLTELDYQSAYWRSRGRPRFYRFKVEHGAELSATKIAGSSGDPNRAPSAASARSAVYGPARPMKTNSRGQSRLGMDSEDQLTPANPSAPATASVGNGSAVYGPAAPIAPTDSAAGNDEEAQPFAMPTSVVVAGNTQAPTREEVAEGISEFSDTSGRGLQTDDFFKAHEPVVIVETFAVEKVEIKRDHGWARVAIESRVAITDGIGQVKHRHDKVRWALQRTESGWEALPPTDRMFVSHDMAVKNLAAQLARMAASERAAQRDEAILREEAAIAGILNALLEPKRK